MASDQDWLDAGLEILRDEGARALTLDRLTQKLGLSTGSFYHHFQGAAGFKTALLARFEAQYTTGFIDLVERDPGGAPKDKLRRLLDLVLTKDGRLEVEVAVRAWALQDAEARRTQERVDRIRIDYVRGLWDAMTSDPAEAIDKARLLYLVLIGAGHVLPQIPPEELRHLLAVSLLDGPERSEIEF